MLNRDLVKSALRSSGFFPVARAVYRKLNVDLRTQHRKDLAFYGQLVPQGSLCFDIGANLGQRSEVFLALGCRTIIVEPNPECRSTLEFLFSGNPKATIVPKAISSKEGSAQIFAHGTDSTASLRADWDSKVFGRDREQTAHTVATTTLDALIKEHGKPDFIKIDVEGFELEALRGLSTAVPLLSFEFHHDEQKAILACLDHLQRFGRISIRAGTMDCEWLGDRTLDVTSYLGKLQSMRAKGDLFVWIE